MKSRSLLPFLAFATVISLSLAQKHHKVFLKSITSLTFTANRYTAGQRSSPIPQLKCITPDTCSVFRPSTVLCHNIGWDGVDVTWRCEADIPDNMRFSVIEVSCEGWGWEGDEYVLGGSCGLEYGLAFVEGSYHQEKKGEEKFFENLKRARSFSFVPSFITIAFKYINSLFSSASRNIVTSLWVAMILYVLYSFFKSCIRSRPRDPSFRGFGGWWPGGGGGGWGGGSGYGGWGGPRRGWGSGYNGDGYQKSAFSRSGRPGFLTGLGLGGVAGYAAGRRAASSSSDSNTAPASTSRFSTSSVRTSSSMRSASGFGGTKRR